jgi:hypothetical protein
MTTCPLLNLYQKSSHKEQPSGCSLASLFMTEARLGGCGPVNVRAGPHLGGGPGLKRPAPTLPARPRGRVSATASACGGSLISCPGSCPGAPRAPVMAGLGESSPGDDLGSFSLRGNKTRVGRAKYPRTEKFPRYVPRCQRSVPSKEDIRGGPELRRATLSLEALREGRIWWRRAVVAVSARESPLAGLCCP